MSIRRIIIAASMSSAMLGAAGQSERSPRVPHDQAAVTFFGDSGGNFIFQGAASLILAPAPDTELLVATVSDVDGDEVKRFKTFPLARGTVALKIADLSPGYYTLRVSVRRGDRVPQTVFKSFAILDDLPSKPEYRFGIDAALSWYGGSDEEVSRAIHAMRMAGIGSVRDRLSWSKVEPKRGAYSWGRFAEVAKLVNAAGLDQVTVFHDSPSWARPGDPVGVNGDRKPSLDNDAVRQFGRAFAKDLGRYVHAVEYWNEQNGDFFAGTPMAYANGLRAFGAGLWSVNPKINLLIGAASNSPGKYFEEIYRNDVDAWFGTRNQHYYGDPDLFLAFQSKEVLPVDRAAGIESKPAWLTEAGYGLKPEADGNQYVSERAQAVHLVKTFATAFAAGYERVFYFFLRELIEEGRNNWGILNSDFSPRAAYVALANLTRNLNGKEFVGHVKSSSSFAAYFGSPDKGYVAIAWGSQIGDIAGSPRRVVDMFGRNVGSATSGSEPFIVSGITKLPSSLIRAQSKAAPNPQVPAILIEGEIAGARVVGAHVTEIPVPATGDVVLNVKLTRLVAAKLDPPRVRCEAGPGVFVSTPAFDAPVPPEVSSTVVSCRFRSELRVGARSAISATVSSPGWSAKTFSSIVAIPSDVALRGAATMRSPAPPLCVDWRARSSPLVLSTVQAEKAPPGRDCGAILVTSRVVSPGDGWVFPIADLPPSAGKLVGLQFESTPLKGQKYPPKPLVMQLVDSKGGVWVLPLDTERRPDGAFSHEATFARATVAPWSKTRTVEPLETASIRQISIGYAGGGTKPGDVVAFKVSGLRGVEGR